MPYNGKIGLWHVAGSWVGENTIDALGSTIRRWAPSADAVYIKTSHGPRWQGAKDQKPDMAINGPDDIERWVNALGRHRLDCHAWAVPVGEDIQREAELIAEACRTPGLKSMILDVEPFDGFWKGSRDDISRLCEAIRREVGDDFHIGISVDPRRQWKDAIHPELWLPHVGSIHPQVYWAFMGRSAADVLKETYAVWGGHGLPIYPVLQAWDVTADAIREAHDAARGVYGVLGVSYFRLGTIGPEQWPAINDETVEAETGPDNVTRTYDWEKVVAPGDPGFMSGTHTGQPLEVVLQAATDVRGAPFLYKATEPRADRVWAQWIADLPTAGTYEISVYIPEQHANAAEARYHIHGLEGKGGAELLVRLNQSRYKNRWVPLAVYDFVAGVNGGRVNLTDLTGETNRTIAFGAVRWRRVIGQVEDVEDKPPVVVTPGNTHGFDPPVGSAAERLSADVWPGTWFDATGFAVYYSVPGAVNPSYHTGVDLNNNRPEWDTDRDNPVYAPADGIVTYSGNLKSSWGHVIVIRHDPLPDGEVVWTRLAHVHRPRVQRGQRVERGEQIAVIGNAYGVLSYHLHYDIIKTDVVERNPGHWPGISRDLVLRHYHNPQTFTLENRPRR